MRAAVVIAALLACPGAAGAQELDDEDEDVGSTDADYLPEGTRLVLPGPAPGCPSDLCTGESVLLQGPHYILSQDAFNTALANTLALEGDQHQRGIAERLRECERRSSRLAQPVGVGIGAGLWKTTKITLIVAAVVAAGVGGYWLGDR